MITMDPRTPDAFEPFVAMSRSIRWWQTVAAGLLLLLSMSLGWIVLLSFRPPVVIVKDRVHGEAATISVASSAPEVTAADARAFFVAMARLRFGWDSFTVMRDMQEFSRQCYRDHRQAEAAHLAERISVDADHPEQTVPRLQWWVQQTVRNTLLLPDSLDAIECTERDDMFHCYMQASVITQSMLAAPDGRPTQHRMVLVATFLRVSHRIETPYGLVVGTLREMPADKLKEANG